MQVRYISPGMRSFRQVLVLGPPTLRVPVLASPAPLPIFVLAHTMADSQAVFQNAFYIGNNFNATLYGKLPRTRHT